MEIMKLMPGSRIEPGVEIWYKGDVDFPMASINGMEEPGG